MRQTDLKELWSSYKKTGDEKAREQLVLAYSPLVKFVAGRMSSGLPAHIEESDLISYGLLGLIGAIERFEPRARDQVRDLRRLADQGLDHRRAALARLGPALGAREGARDRGRPRRSWSTSSAGRRPTQEVADALEMTIDDFQESLIQISNSTVVALDELWTVSDSSGDQVSLLDTMKDPNAVDPARELGVSELKDRLANAISRLPEREKLVIALYYYENLTLREIGEVLGVTESRVSQLHTKAVLRLKSRLQTEVEVDPQTEPP